MHLCFVLLVIYMSSQGNHVMLLSWKSHSLLLSNGHNIRPMLQCAWKHSLLYNACFQAREHTRAAANAGAEAAAAISHKAMQQVTPLYFSVAFYPALLLSLPAQHVVEHDLVSSSRVCLLHCVSVLQKAVRITTAASWVSNKPSWCAEPQAKSWCPSRAQATGPWQKATNLSTKGGSHDACLIVNAVCGQLAQTLGCAAGSLHQTLWLCVPMLLQEKRKRDVGQAKSAKNYVEEEKRLARNFGMYSGFDTWTRILPKDLTAAHTSSCYAGGLPNHCSTWTQQARSQTVYLWLNLHDLFHESSHICIIGSSASWSSVLGVRNVLCKSTCGLAAGLLYQWLNPCKACTSSIYACLQQPMLQMVEQSDSIVLSKFSM